MRIGTGRRGIPLIALAASLRLAMPAPAEQPPAAATGETATPAGGEVVVARVNGEAIVLRDIERELGNLHSSADPGEHRRAFDVERLMFKMVNDILLGQEARAMEMHKDAKIVEKVGAQRRDLAIRLLERSEIDEPSLPTDEEVRAAFQEQYRRATFRVVTSYDEAGARDLLARLLDGDDMEALARDSSVDPYALRGGLVKDIARIDLQADIADVVFTIEPGEIRGPIRTDLGWSVVRLESLEEADPARFEELRKTLWQLVRHHKSRQLKAQLAKRLRERFAVTIDDERAASVQPLRLPDSRLMPEYDKDEADAVVARIGSEQVLTVSEYARGLLDRWTGVRNETAARAAAPMVLQSMIESKLLLAEALRRGYHEDPRVERAVHKFETQLLVPRYLEEVVGAGIEIERAELRSYYNEHKSSFRPPPRLRIGQITVAGYEEAERVARLLREGADLGWLAERHSIDRFKETGGIRGWISPQPTGDPRSDRLLAAEVGEVLDPAGSPGNYVVQKILAREKQEPYAFLSVSGNVRDAVFSQKFRKRLDAFMKKLRSRSEISIDDEALAKLQIAGTVEKGTAEKDAAHEHGQ